MSNMKRCTSGDNCLHPDGPILDKSEFDQCKGGKDGLRAQCKLCRRKARQEWRIKNLDKLHEDNRQYRLENADRERARRKKYALENPDRERESKRQWRMLNADRVRVKQQAWRLNNADKEKQIIQRRRTRKAGLPIFYPPNTWEEALRLVDYRCLYCQIEFSRTKLHADHWLPLMMRLDNHPGHVPWNVIPSCSGCNCRKQDKEPQSWVIEYFGKQQGGIVLTRVNTFIAIMKRQYIKGLAS